VKARTKARARVKIKASVEAEAKAATLEVVRTYRILNRCLIRPKSVQIRLKSYKGSD
jgi:hypothetical protein